MADLAEVAFVGEPAGIDAMLRSLTVQSKFRVSDWTDAYLAAFAQLAGLRLVTFDKGFGQYKGLALLTL